MVMQMEAPQQAGANYYERTFDGKARRNGFKETRLGELSLQKPQSREFSFETNIFDKYSCVERALVHAITESYTQGVTTRQVQKIVSHLGLDHLSPARVFWITKELDDAELFIISSRSGIEKGNESPGIIDEKW